MQINKLFDALCTHLKSAGSQQLETSIYCFSRALSHTSDQQRQILTSPYHEHSWTNSSGTNLILCIILLENIAMAWNEFPTHQQSCAEGTCSRRHGPTTWRPGVMKKPWWTYHSDLMFLERILKGMCQHCKHTKITTWQAMLVWGLHCHQEAWLSKGNELPGSMARKWYDT